MPRDGRSTNVWWLAGDLRRIASEPSILTYRVANFSGIFFLYLDDGAKVLQRPARVSADRVAEKRPAIA